MSPITKEFTKEQLQQIIETDHVQCGEASSLARIALASLEAEPVGEVSEQRDGLVMDGMVDLGGASTHRIIKGASKMKRLPLGTKFYTAPPAPVSVPDAMEMDDDFDSAFEHGKAVGWNAYRAAMLQAEPVSNSDELPLDYLQGHKDGLEWAAQLAEANHPQTGDWLYDDPIDLARAISKGPDMPTAQAGNHTEQHLDMVDHSGDANKMVAGNSPVIPDGWKLVPIDPTKDMLRAGQSVVGFWLNTVHCYSKMLAAAPAAPQQEVTQALAKGMERYGDAMQKLADSGD
ncbi:DUF551 domain-containing protein [Escherichia coli]|uniref:DUF551 domain-containing protein n=1 Tax=Escherichia coli TaxID=562 RepID=UPI0023F88AB1|nr:DUF551 domain-containing protein [Escherichia coli]MDF7625619.1 DUF551 domain-containing protein [Escherichia coli]MDF7636101.1 DUF551 domain-containing protein [Escherichia coli]